MAVVGSTFRSDEPMLNELLEDIQKGHIQLPDFQRGWVWDDNHIRSLLASISLSYPIGAVMFLETGDDGVRFRPRLIEGVTLAQPPKPDFLILDGQQRLTSVYLSLISNKPVPTRTDKNQDIERYYFLDMRMCLSPQTDRFDAIISVPAERMIKSDFGRKTELDVSTRQQEYELGMFPAQLLFDIARRDEWRMGFYEHFGYEPTKIQFYNEFERQIWQRFYQYKVPVIVLVRGTPKEAVCQVFEQVNTGGVTLSVFELMTATFAADDFALREDWRQRQQQLDHDRYRAVREFDATSFLTSVTLLSSYQRHLATGSAVSCKRKDVLNLTLAEYKRNADLIGEGMKQAARLLAQLKIFDDRSLPYSTQLIPLAAICAVLGRRFEQEPIRQKLAQWYWCGVFGELYGGANETRFGLDLPDVIRWIDGGDTPRTIRDANFSPTRLLSMQSRLSAAYKGLMALLMKEKNGCKDFESGDTIEVTTYFSRAVDIHHIFPKAYCERTKLLRSQWNSAVNKTPLTYSTNRQIGGDAPSIYLPRIERRNGMSEAALDNILVTHAINPSLLRQDHFGGFLRDRAARLLDYIEQAMGKAITGRDSDEVIAAFGGPLLVETQ